MRIKILQIAFGCVFVFLCLGLFYFQVIQFGRYRQLSESNRIRLIPQEGTRGRILDRNGVVIIDNRLSYNVLLLPQQNGDIKQTLSRLADILGVPGEYIRSRYRQGGYSFFTPVVLAEKIDKKNAMIIEELKSELPGVIIQTVPQRYYPYGSLAVHITGYLGEIDQWRLMQLRNYGYRSKDIIGYGGIEERYDYYLRQEEGGLQVEADSRGKIIRVIGFRPPRSGKDIQLTVDLRIQKIIEEALNGNKGAVIIIDSYGGEILGMASFPNFDPTVFLNKSDSTQDILDDPGAPLLNRAISGAYPLGSVFKIVVAAAGLETKKIDVSTTFNCPGSIKLGNREYACWDKHGSQDIIAAITHSCNVFFYRLGLLLGPDKIYKYALRLGFGKRAKIDLPSESSGFVPNPLSKRLTRFENWYPGDTANFSIGQGDLLATPLQAVRAMAGIANEGYLPRPHLIKAIDGREVNAYKKITSPLNFPREVLEPIKTGLRQVAGNPDGTANILADSALSVSGKTGTAQVGSRQPHAWFVGYFPAKGTSYAVCVFLEHSGHSINACVVTKKIIEAMKQEGLL